MFLKIFLWNLDATALFNLPDFQLPASTCAPLLERLPITEVGIEVCIYSVATLEAKVAFPYQTHAHIYSDCTHKDYTARLSHSSNTYWPEWRA